MSPSQSCSGEGVGYSLYILPPPPAPLRLRTRLFLFQTLLDRSHIMSKCGGLKVAVRSFRRFSCGSYKVVRLWWC